MLLRLTNFLKKQKGTFTSLVCEDTARTWLR